jgi:tight adherence protein B
MTPALLLLAAAAVLGAGTRRGPGRDLAALNRALDRIAGRGADWVLGKLRPATRRDDVGALCTAICAELKAGASSNAALIAAAREVPVIPRARTAAVVGEPVADALAQDARAAGSVALAGVAACFAAAQGSGAGLADGLTRVAALARAQRQVGQDLAAETAGPRATARILGLLPVATLAIGQLLGADPVRWLIESPVGWLCLVLGLAFLAAGRLWAGAIIRQGLPGRGLR